MRQKESAKSAPVRTAVLFLLGVGSLAGGCSLKPDTAQQAAEQVSLRVVDENGLAEALAQHRGRVVLVDFWALWCAPCLEFFPHSMGLRRQWADRGLAVISVSLDDADQLPAVRRFLARQGAMTDNFLSRYGTGGRSFEVFEIEGGLPYVKLYGRDGALRKTYTATSLDPKALDQTVDALLGEK